MAKKITFLKGNLCIYPCFIDVFYCFFCLALKKNYKMRPDLRWILLNFVMLSRFYLQERIQDPDSVTRIALKD